MREIKFRIFSTNKKMVYTTSEIWRCGEYSSLCFAVNKEYEDALWDIDVEEKFVTMQYTGIKDDDGKELYEGDVIEYTRLRTMMDGFITYKVVLPLLEDHTEYMTLLLHRKGMKLIGNIYENPELKEGKL